MDNPDGQLADFGSPCHRFGCCLHIFSRSWLFRCLAKCSRRAIVLERGPFLPQPDHRGKGNLSSEIWNINLPFVLQYCYPPLCLSNCKFSHASSPPPLPRPTSQDLFSLVCPFAPIWKQMWKKTFLSGLPPQGCPWVYSLWSLSLNFARMAVHLLKNELAFATGRGYGLPTGVVEGERAEQSARLVLAPKEAISYWQLRLSG